jgi:hypothetical protein
MRRSPDIEPLAAKIATVARVIDSSPTTVRRLVDKGVLPPPFRLTPTGEPLWWMPDVRLALERAAGHPGQPVEPLAA